MIIRLIIPLCNAPKGGYCDDALNFQGRLQILQNAMQPDVDLIVTSHNFFDFSSCNHINLNNICVNIVAFINTHIINYLNCLEIKRPIVLGFDIKRGGNINPYGGIDAIVCFLDIDQNKYQYKTHIWECWKSSGRCNTIKCFQAQNNKRFFSLNTKKIGLLSCGDMYTYCNKRNGVSYLGNPDVYLDLAHLSLPFQRTCNSVNVNLSNQAKYVLITQQYQQNNFKIYFHNNSYKLIFPNNSTQKIQPINNNPLLGYYADVII